MNTHLSKENSDLKDKVHWMKFEHREQMIMAESRWHYEHWKKVYEMYGIPEGGYSKKGASVCRASRVCADEFIWSASNKNGDVTEPESD